MMELVEREREVAALAALLDAVPAGEGDVSFAALHGLFWVALNLAAEGPLMLAIDDLHWCDRPSLRFVAYLARRLEGQPVLVAATVRSGEPGTDVALLGEVAHDPAAVAVRPIPLSADAVRALVRERLGDAAEEAFCEACHRATGGNPLFLRQLVTALEADHVRPDAAHAGVVLEIGPRAVSRTVIMRLARLSEDAIAVARAVSVLAESATLPSVAALTGLTEARVADATGMLARAEILRREAPIGFVHALVRDAVYQELPPGERELLRDLGLAEVLTDGQAATAHLSEAYEELDDPRSRAIVAHALARALLFTGSPAEAAVFAEQTAAELPPELADDSRSLTAFELMTGFFGVDAPARLERLEPFRDPPARDAELGAKMLAGCAGLWWAYRGGSARECSALALAALAGGELTIADNGLMMMAALLTLVKADRPEANPEWAFAQSEAHRHGSLLGISSIHLWHGFTLLQYGELADADESLLLAQEEFDAWGFADVARLYSASFHARTLLARGRLDAARAVHASTRPEPSENSEGSRYWRCTALELLVAEGRDAEAVVAYEEYERHHAHVRLPTAAHARSLAARALDRLGRRDEALALAEAELADARRWGAPGTVGPSLRALGLLQRSDGLALLEESAAVLERSQARLELAKSLADLGAALRRERRPSDAREPLRRALELADACSAEALVERVRSELYATGVRPRTTALGGVEALTASERRVAAFAADGQSNRDIAQALFVTPKTVEVHLSNAYRKLGIRSRRELPSALGAS
jgi:DNA-binding CsgD family transcriptional regulator